MLGILNVPHSTTQQGVEIHVSTTRFASLSHKLGIQFAVNHLGHFLLTNLLLKKINKSSGRVLNLSSIAHKVSYTLSSNSMTDMRWPMECFPTQIVRYAIVLLNKS